jgi:ATP-binding cassette, subfamily G (WHITE), eye pigment precursor transporter
VESGTLTAIIGGSGAGKTTLLASISQRIRGNLTGELLLNGCTVTQNEMTKLSGFVSQYDITIDSLTPKEHLNFMVIPNGKLVSDFMLNLTGRLK